MKNKKTVYIFIDESGGIKNDTKYFILTAILSEDLSLAYGNLNRKYYEYLSSDYSMFKDKQEFHCCDDNKYIRKSVFDIIKSYSCNFTSYSVVCEKSKFKDYDEKFIYEKMFTKLVSNASRSIIVDNLMNVAVETFHSIKTGKKISYEGNNNIIVVTDSLPVKNKKNRIKQSLKSGLKALNGSILNYKLFHHDSKTHYGLQIVDYVSFAIFKKFEDNNDEYFDVIKENIHIDKIDPSD